MSSAMRRPSYIRTWIWNYAAEVVAKCAMDESHGMQHFINTAGYARQILKGEREPIVGMKRPDAVRVITDAAFVHDLIDGKYRNEKEALNELGDKFAAHQYKEWDIIEYIITRISFSKRAEREHRGLPMIEPGRLARAVAIVADADQLDAYDVNRVIEYQRNKFWNATHSALSEDERRTLSRGWIKTILVKRVLKYRDVYLTTDIARKLAAPMHEDVAEYVRRELSNEEMYPYPVFE